MRAPLTPTSRARHCSPCHFGGDWRPRRIPTARSSEAQTTSARKKSSTTASGDAPNGKLIFERQGCNKCHGFKGEGGSTLAQNGGVPRIASTTLALPAFIRLVRKPKGQMPPFGSERVTDSDLADVYAFLRSSAPPVESKDSTTSSIDNGQRLFTNYGCHECHGSQGQGSTQTGGSRLGPPQTPFSAFVSYVRQPTGQMPPYTTTTGAY